MSWTFKEQIMSQVRKNPSSEITKAIKKKDRNNAYTSICGTIMRQIDHCNSKVVIDVDKYNMLDAVSKKKVTGKIIDTGYLVTLRSDQKKAIIKNIRDISYDLGTLIWTRIEKAVENKEHKFLYKFTICKDMNSVIIDNLKKELEDYTYSIEIVAHPGQVAPVVTGMPHIGCCNCIYRGEYFVVEFSVIGSSCDPLCTSAERITGKSENKVVNK